MQKTRKLISMLLAVMMVLSMCTVGMVSAYALPEDAVINDTEGNDASSIDGELYGLMGDADANGTINVKDATQIQKYAAKLITLDETSEALADVNLDGKVNVKDATAIQKWVAKFDVEEPINCLVYIPAVEPTTVATEPTTAASEDEPTTAATVDETEPTTSVIVVPTTVATEPTEAPSTEAKPTEATEPKPTEATEPKPTDATEPKPTDAPADDVTIYFQNNWMWSNVSAHMWSSNGDLTKWPGTAMTFVENDGAYDIYSVVVPADAVGIVITGNKDTAPDELDQTPDILTWADGQCFYMVWDSSLNEGAGGNVVGSFEYVVPTVPTTVVTQPATSATQDETDAQEPTTDAEEPTTEVEEFEDSNVFLRGTMSDWSTGLAFKKTADENVVELTIDLEADTYEFKLVVDGSWYGNSSEFEDECENWGFRVKEKNSEEDTQNCKIIATGGTYTFTVGLAEFGNSPAVLRLTVVKAEVEEPTTDVEEPTTDAEEPTTDVEEPTTDVEEPTTDVEEPTTDAEEPTTDAEEPTTDAEEPTTEAEEFEDSNVFLRGTMSDWSTGLAFKKTADENVVELTIDLEADTYEFKLVVDGSWYGNSSEFEDECENWGFRVKEKNSEEDTQNCKMIATGGTYTFTVDLAEFGNSPAVLRLTVVKAEVEEPTTEVEEPTTEVEEPTTEVEEPTTEVEEPTTEVEEPTTEVEEPTTEVEEPTTEEKPDEPEGYVAYCVNSANWDALAAHAWNDGGSGTAWPGVAMTKTGEQINGFDVYKVTFDVEYDNIIFNNNNNGSQTDNLTFNVGKYYDVRSAAWYDKLTDVPAPSKTAANVFLPGAFNSWSTTKNEFAFNAEGDTICYLEMDLAANTSYEFKVITMNGTTTEWRGLKYDGTITGDVADIVCSRSTSGNATIKTAAAGKYIFAFDTVNYTLSITFPG